MSDNNNQQQGLGRDTSENDEPKHLVVCVDEYAPAVAAVRCAEQLIIAYKKQQGVYPKVTLVNAVDPALLVANHAVWAGPMVSFTENDSELVTLQEFSRRLLVSFIKAMKHDVDPSIKIKGVHVVEEPKTAILNEAKTADMIIMGTHGRRGFSRSLLGSVAESVMRNSNVPVLAVRCDVEAAEAAKLDFDFSSVLVPSDASDSAKLSFSAVAVLSSFFPVKSASVCSVMKPTVGSDGKMHDDRVRHRTELERSLNAAVSELSAGVGEVTQKILETDEPVYDALCDELKNHGFMAITTHGRSGLSRMFMGSVVERVLRTAPSAHPILVTSNKTTGEKWH